MTTTAAYTKNLTVPRLLIKEIRVHNRRRILPTYRVPAAVRAIPPKVELAGLEPATSWVRSRRSPN